MKLSTHIQSRLYLLALFISMSFAGLSQDQDYNMMLLGNSITQAEGYYGGTTDLKGYRYYFWKKLDDAGVKFDFVGSMDNYKDDETPDGLPAGFDMDHEGHWGWRADELLLDEKVTGEGILSGWLLDYTVDVAFIHIGTNDAFQSSFNVDHTIQDIKGLVKILRAYNPRVTIFIAEIIPSTVDTYSNIDPLNVEIAKLDTDTELLDSKSPIIIVDLNAVVDAVSETYDGTHPNNAGASNMADEWYSEFVTANVTPKHRWTGAIDSDWTKLGNWNQTGLPGSVTDVVIPSNAANWPVITTDFEVGDDCRDFIMEKGSQMTVEGDYMVQKGSFVSINGNATLIVEGDFVETNLASTDTARVGFGASSLTFTGTANNSVSATPFFNHGGKIDVGTLTNKVQNKFLPFDCFQPFLLKSVKVWANGTDDIEVYWKTSDGVLQDSVILTNIVGGWQRITLNFLIPQGVNHRLGYRTDNIPGGGETLLRDKSSDGSTYEFNYPFMIGHVGAINPVLLARKGYNCFYDWEFIPCFYDVSIDKSGYTLTTDGDVGVANDLVVNEGSYLTNDVGDELVVGNNFKLLADGSGIASFLDKGTLTSRGTTLVEQYLTSDVWHYVSSPISNGESGVYTGVYVNWWDEVNNTWTSIVETDVALTPMKGYAAWQYTTAFTASYMGALNSGTQSITVTNSGVSAWNLVGNPYPSSMDWDAFSGWTKTNVNNSIYFWSGVGGGGGGNYGYYVGGSSGSGVNGGTNIIPPGQGFMVKASAASGTLGVTNDVRVHDAQSFYKSGQAGELPVIRLQAQGINDKTDETLVRFVEESTIEHDGQYDAYKLYGSNFPQVFTYTEAKTELAINSLPDYDPSTIIHMGFTAPEAGEYTISLTEFLNFDDGTELFIEDLLTSQVQNLSENPVYKLQSETDDEPNRFLLYFGWTTDQEEKLESLVYIYSFDNNVVVKLPVQTGMAQLEIYDLMGKLIYSDDLSGEYKVTIPIYGNSGHYVVKLVTSSGIYNEKVTILN